MNLKWIKLNLFYIFRFFFTTLLTIPTLRLRGIYFFCLKNLKKKEITLSHLGHWKRATIVWARGSAQTGYPNTTRVYVREIGTPPSTYWRSAQGSSFFRRRHKSQLANHNGNCFYFVFLSLIYTMFDCVWNPMNNVMCVFTTQNSLSRSTRLRIFFWRRGGRMRGRWKSRGAGMSLSLRFDAPSTCTRFVSLTLRKPISWSNLFLPVG